MTEKRAKKYDKNFRNEPHGELKRLLMQDLKKMLEKAKQQGKETIKIKAVCFCKSICCGKDRMPAICSAFYQVLEERGGIRKAGKVIEFPTRRKSPPWEEKDIPKPEGSNLTIEFKL